MAVAVLLDESGSMGSKDRYKYAQAAAIILQDFCYRLHIPMMVYGHSTSGDLVDLYSYVEYDVFADLDRYRLADIQARRSNRDGAALRYEPAPVGTARTGGSRRRGFKSVPLRVCQLRWVVDCRCDWRRQGRNPSYLRPVIYGYYRPSHISAAPYTVSKTSYPHIKRPQAANLRVACGLFIAFCCFVHIKKSVVSKYGSECCLQ